MLGLCCQYIENRTKRNGTVETINIIEEQGLQYGQFLKGKYTNAQVEAAWVNNAQELLKILKRVNNEGIKLFRVSSTLLPLYDSLPDLLRNCQAAKDVLAEAGKFVLDNQMRITTHPDQFVVISSNKQDVINNSIRMLNHHAWMFDQMGLPVSPYYAINIHGGTKGNITTLIDSIKKMGSNARGRLTLENDERSYDVSELFKVYEETGVPVCWDSHHHTFNDAGLSLPDALNLAKRSWGNVRPLTHLSNTDPSLVNGSFTEKRKHSDYVHYVPDCQLLGNNAGEIDIELEFKMKNMALFKAVKDFNLNLV
jgi:UV damage endonuclease UvdE